MVTTTSKFQNIYHITNLHSLLTQQTYSNFGNLFLMLYEHRNKILKDSINLLLSYNLKNHIQF